MKKLYYSLSAVCLILSLFCAYKSLPARPSDKPKPVADAYEIIARMDETRAAAPQEDEPDEEPAVCPIDFQALLDLNPDIYAWIHSPGTSINHPVLQNLMGDNDFYLTHGVDLREDENGCLFSEYVYSDREFIMPVSVIYGHRMRSGEMFGQLQAVFSAEGALEQYPEIIVYQADKELHYRIFGASEFSNIHIPHYYRRFIDRSNVSEFVDSVKHYRTLLSQFDESVPVDESDRLLVLSTCSFHVKNGRFVILLRQTK